MNNKPTFGSLFAGIGGFDLGLERAGWECKWQVENDKYANRVLEKNWPDVRRWDDVRTFPPKGDWDVDLICGGFPCQDISFAGKGVGIEGKSSGLWTEFARIIRVLAPKIVVVENVAALLVRGLDIVLGTLASLGFDAEWETVPAAAFGSPQVRNRCFVVAHSQQNGWHKHEGESILRGMDSTKSHASGERNSKAAFFVNCGKDDPNRFAPSTPRGCYSDGRSGPLGVREWDAEPDILRVGDGVPAWLDRLGCLGNAVVPQVAEWIGRRILQTQNK